MSSSQIEHIAKFGNDNRENISFTINAGESVICHFADNGTDNATDKYFNLSNNSQTHFALKVSISVNKIATITAINGTTLKSPMTLGTATRNNFTEGFRWNTITVRADLDATTFEIYAS